MAPHAAPIAASRVTAVDLSIDPPQRYALLRGPAEPDISIN
jgi:hypothetical protein